MKWRKISDEQILRSSRKAKPAGSRRSPFGRGVRTITVSGSGAEKLVSSDTHVPPRPNGAAASTKEAPAYVNRALAQDRRWVALVSSRDQRRGSERHEEERQDLNAGLYGH